jgi:hypothetical protein
MLEPRKLSPEQEERRRAFTASLDAAVARAEREGYVELEQVLADIDEIIDTAERGRPPAAD